MSLSLCCSWSHLDGGLRRGFPFYLLLALSWLMVWVCAVFAGWSRDDLMLWGHRWVVHFCTVFFRRRWRALSPTPRLAPSSWCHCTHVIYSFCFLTPVIYWWKCITIQSSRQQRMADSEDKCKSWQCRWINSTKELLNMWDRERISLQTHPSPLAFMSGVTSASDSHWLEELEEPAEPVIAAARGLAAPCPHQFCF